MDKQELIDFLCNSYWEGNLEDAVMVVVDLLYDDNPTKTINEIRQELEEAFKDN